METQPGEQPEQTPTPGEGAFDQAAIDALLDGATDGAPDAPGDTTGGGPVAPEPEAAKEINQADIDALMNAAGGGDADAAAQPAEEPSAAPTQTEAAQTASEPGPDARLDTLGRPFDEAAAAMQAALEEEAAAPSGSQPEVSAPPPTAPAPVGPPLGEPFKLPEFTGGANPEADAKRMSMLNDVNLRVKIELGRTQMLVEDVLRIGDGSVVELDKLAGDPVDVYVNERLIARGEVLVLNDNFCIRISEVYSADPHRVAT